MTETFEQQNLSDRQLESLRIENIFFKFGCLVVPSNIGIQVVLNMVNLQDINLISILNVAGAVVLAILYWALECYRSK